MKWALVSAAAAAALAQAEAMDVNFNKATHAASLRSARRLQASQADFTAAAMSCIFAEPCATAGCVSAAGIAQSPLCSGAIGNFSAAVNFDSCDGDSMGVAALMLDGQMPNELATGVCGSVRDDALMSTCVVPASATLKALVETMDAHKTGACQNFTVLVGEVLTGGDEYSSDPDRRVLEEDPEHNATMTYSVSQGATLSGTATSVLTMMTNATYATAVNDAIVALNMTWADFLSPGVGLLPVKNPSMLGATCFASATVEGGISQDMVAMVFAATLLDSPPPSASDITTFLTTNYGATAVANFLATVANNADFPADLKKPFADHVVYENVSRATIEDDADAFVDHCTGAQDTVICEAEARALVNATLNGKDMSIAAALGQLPISVFLAGFEASMATCTGMSSAAGYWLTGLSLYVNGGSASPSEAQQRFVETVFMAAGCALFQAEDAAGTDPMIVSKATCFQQALLTTPNADALAAIMTDSFGMDAIYTMEDSVPTLISRCSAAQVQLVAAPTVPPTAGGGAPTVGEISATPAAQGAAALLSVAALAAMF